jgi:hypothetical protein
MYLWEKERNREKNWGAFSLANGQMPDFRPSAPHVSASFYGAGS